MPDRKRLKTPRKSCSVRREAKKGVDRRLPAYAFVFRGGFGKRRRGGARRCSPGGQRALRFRTPPTVSYCQTDATMHPFGGGVNRKTNTEKPTPVSRQALVPSLGWAKQTVGLGLHVIAIEHRGGRLRGVAPGQPVGAARHLVAEEGPCSPDSPLHPRFPLSARSVQEHPRPRASPAEDIVSRRCFGRIRGNGISRSDLLAAGRATRRFSRSQLENRLGVIRLIILFSVCAECRDSRQPKYQKGQSEKPLTPLENSFTVAVNSDLLNLFQSV